MTEATERTATERRKRIEEKKAHLKTLRTKDMDTWAACFVSECLTAIDRAADGAQNSIEITLPEVGCSHYNMLWKKYFNKLSQIDINLIIPLVHNRVRAILASKPYCYTVEGPYHRTRHVEYDGMGRDEEYSTIIIRW